MNQHLILIGFKHVGKSAIGKLLAEKIKRDFFDLDEQIELFFAKTYETKLSCRQIMQSRGEIFFRELEAKVLAGLLQKKPCVISLGGGTPIRESNRELIKDHNILLIQAPKGIVFERIMVNGRPAFFSPEETPLASFNKLWEEREQVYNSLAKFSIVNNVTLEQAVEKIINNFLLKKLEIKI